MSDEHPPSQYPQTGPECWELGQAWYNEWHSLQTNGPLATYKELQLVLLDIQHTQGQVIDGVPGSEEQLRLSGQIGPMMNKRDALQTQLDEQLARIPWLEKSMRGLGEFMDRNALIYKGDVPTFPVNI